MREFSVFLLAFSAVVPIVMAYKNADRIYQLPFLYGMAVCVYILPTLFGVMESKAVLTDTQYIRYCVFSSICMWSGLIGYWAFFNKPILKPTIIYAHDPDRMSKFLYVIMIFAFIAITQMGGYDVSERYGGIYAVLLFPARCLRPATIMLLILYLLKPSRGKLTFLIISLLFSLKIIIIDGRRSEVFNLFITIAFPLFFIKGIRMPKSFIAPAIFGAIVVFTFLPAYRNYTIKGDFNAVSGISIGKIIDSYIGGGMTSEVVEAARNVDVADKSGTFNYGSTFYNVFVYQYAASTFFGKEFKESLMVPSNLDLVKLRDKNAKYQGDEYHNYLAPTGFAAVFYEFGYAGFLAFFVFGYLAKKYYTRAVLKKDVTRLMFYCFFATFILFSVYDSMFFIPSTMPIYLLVYWGAKRYSRVKSSRFLIHQS